MAHINIPDPVIEITTRLDGWDAAEGRYRTIDAAVEVGGVAVLERTYPIRGYHEPRTPDSVNWENAESEATEKVAAEFGHALRRLIGGEQ